MLSEAVEAACERARGKPMADVVQDVVEAFVDAKMERTDISTALYRIAADVDGPTLVRRAVQRSEKALEAAPRISGPKLQRERSALGSRWRLSSEATYGFVDVRTPYFRKWHKAD
jgi:hypothetical protein